MGLGMSVQKMDVSQVVLYKLGTRYSYDINMWYYSSRKTTNTLSNVMARLSIFFFLASESPLAIPRMDSGSAVRVLA
jgi:hypothetical protein